MPSLTTAELDEIYAFAIKLGKDAGNILQQAASIRINGKDVQRPATIKASEVDIVTETDEGVYP